MSANAPLKHSRAGIASCLVFLVAIVGEIAFVSAHTYCSDCDPPGLLMFYMLILNVVGFLLGVTGARNKGEDRRFAILGLALNVIDIIGNKQISRE